MAGLVNTSWSCLILPIRIHIIRKDGLLLLLKPYRGSTSSNVQLGGVNHADGSVTLSSVIGATPLVEKKSDDSLTFSGRDYGMNAPLTKWHERVRHIPIMEKLNQIHNHNLINLDNKHKKLEKESKLRGGGGDVEVDDEIDSDEEPMSDRIVRHDEPMIHGFYKLHDDKSLKHTNCDVCRQTNLRQEPQKHHSLFQQSEVKTGRVFATVLRSVSIRSFHGHGYAASFVEHTDDGSPGILFVYFMKNKSRATAVLQRFIDDCKKLGIKITWIQSDRGIEYFEQEGIGRIFDKEPILHLISI
jgi:hypothetical protein